MSSHSPLPPQPAWTLEMVGAQLGRLSAQSQRVANDVEKLIDDRRDDRAYLERSLKLHRAPPIITRVVLILLASFAGGFMAHVALAATRLVH